MPKALNTLALALLAASLCARAAAQDAPAAQTPPPAPTPEWVTVSPAGEEFTALMPKQPLRLEVEARAEELSAAGQRYTARAGAARYVVWSLKDTRDIGGRLRPISYEGWAFGGESHYLDLIAEVAWGLLVRPEFERLEAEARRTGVKKTFSPSMWLRNEFDIGGRYAREYTVRLENEGGPVYISESDGRVYVVAALAPDPDSAESKRFVDSFALRARAPGPGPGAGAGVLVNDLKQPPAFGTPDNPRAVAPIDAGALPPAPKPGGAPADDGNRPFKQSEVTRKALITRKPEPGFTESARKFNVTGVVRLRAILSKTGEMTNINVVKYLPHGLTEVAIDAAKGIGFTPAQKDGRPVSQYVILEYNFNIY